MTSTAEPGLIGALEKALADHQRGNHDDARKQYESILRIDPDHADAHNLFGALRLVDGAVDDAVRHARRAVALDEGNADFLNNLGNALKAAGAPSEASDAYTAALAADPAAVDPRYNLGLLCMEGRRFSEAVEQFQALMALPGGNESAIHNAFVTASRLGAETAAAHNDWQSAERLLARAATVSPEAHSIWERLATARKRLGKLGAAEEAAHRALTLAPDSPGAHNGMANILKDTGRIDSAIDHYRQAVSLEPGFVAAHSNLLLAMQYDPETTAERVHAECQAWWQQHGAQQRVDRAFDSHADPNRPLRVGFMSGDFRRHAVSLFFLPLIEHLDPERFHTVCYSDAAVPDDVTQRIQKAAGTWRPIAGADDDWVTQQVLQDRIDILVDLAGHTAGNRLNVFCRKPAPILVTWLGYPDTTGIATMDYRLTDAIADPLDAPGPAMAETLVRIEDGFHCYGPIATDPSPNRRSPKADGGITFGCFNHLAKVNAATLAVWASVLQAVPNSRLMLKNHPLGDDTVRERIVRQFADLGIDSQRLVFSGYLSDYGDHLNAYHHVDIALDTFPYNGTTTTCDALWMGVPVVTLVGNRSPGRVGASLLAQIGMTDWAVDNRDQYVATAVSLAADGPKRERLRCELRGCMTESPLMAPDDFARRMGDAFEGMWQQWCADHPQDGRGGDGAMTRDDPMDDDAASIRERVAAFPFWYHKITLPHGVVTPGWAPLEPDAYGIPKRLDGLRVLDVGAWDGFWSFEALRRGARSVLAIDDFSDFLGSLENRDRRAWENFDLCRDILNIDPDQCQRIEMSVYNLDPERVGHFDVVFFFGTLYHLRYPLLALDRLASVCHGDIYTESAILDDFSPYRGGLGKGYPDQPLMEFYPNAEYGNNTSNWWVPSLSCMTQLVGAAGFEPVRSWKLADRPETLAFCRGFVHGRKPK